MPPAPNPDALWLSESKPVEELVAVERVNPISLLIGNMTGDRKINN